MNRHYLVARRATDGVRAVSRDRFIWMIGLREATHEVAKSDWYSLQTAGPWSARAGHN